MSFHKFKPVKSKVTLGNFARRVPYCQACGVPEGAAALHIHHIIKRGRSDEECNLMRLCGARWNAKACHDRAEGVYASDCLPLGVILAIKRLRDPDACDDERMRQLLLKNLPDLLPIPADLIESWEKWRSYRERELA